jgi:hypothetical protein
MDCRTKRRVTSLRPIWALSASAICVFAFAATTTVRPEQIIRYDKEYYFDFSRDELIRRLEDLSLESAGAHEIRSGESRYIYSGTLDDDICDSNGGQIKMRVSSRPPDKSTLLLETVSYHCDSGPCSRRVWCCPKANEQQSGHIREAPAAAMLIANTI